MKTDEIVLALDPGKDYFAWAAIRGDGTVIETGILQSTIKDFKIVHFSRQVSLYTKEIWKILHKYKFFAVVAERYQIRGRFTVGENCEFINLMLGAMLMQTRLFKDRPHVQLISASTWKNWLSQLLHGKSGMIEKTPDVFSYPEVTKEKSKRKTNPFPILEHQFDAIGIGLWFVCHETASTDHRSVLYKHAKPSIDRLWAKGRGDGSGS